MERDAVIVAGFGFRAGASVASLHAAYLLALERNERPHVACLATAADKAAALAPFAEILGLPLSAVSPQALALAETLTASAASLKARGTGSLAEASALAAAGQGAGYGARLLGPRCISPDRMATCALAQGISS